MAFPTGQANGAVTTVNGIIYVYNSTDGTWAPVTSGSVGSGLIAAGGTLASLTVAGAFTATLSTAAQPNITSVGTLSSLTVSGAVNAGTVNGALGGPFNGTIGATTANTAVITTAQITSLGVGTGASGTTGELRCTNQIVAFYSDRRLKTVTGKIEDALDKVDKLTGVFYTQNKLAESFGYNDYSSQVGVIAQEVKEVLPEIVKSAPFDIAEDGTSISGEEYLTVQYEKLVPLLIEAVKELRRELNSIKQKDQ
jgi:hypothetical protein